MIMSDAALHAAPHGSFIVRFGDGEFRSWIDGLVAPDCADTTAEDESGSETDGYRAGYAAGFADGQAAASQAIAEPAARLGDLIGSLEVLQPVSQSVLASMLAECVAAIIGRSLADTMIDGASLAASAAAMIAAMTDEIEAAALHVHPADAELLHGHALAVDIVVDPSLARGTLRLATRQGWLEDGAQLRLARFRSGISGGHPA